MVDLAGVEAELKEGLLTIHLPKREEAKPRQIEVVPDLQAAIQRAGTKPALLLINRGGNSFFLTVRPR